MKAIDFELLDSEGYPTEEALSYIEKYDCLKNGFIELINLIEEMWWMSDWGFKLTGKRNLKLELHTGGWSGNESIIYVLHTNFFWSMCWVKSIRGGHYWFEIPDFQDQEKGQP